jgi:hypothetical protein
MTELHRARHRRCYGDWRDLTPEEALERLRLRLGPWWRRLGAVHGDQSR